MAKINFEKHMPFILLTLVAAIINFQYFYTSVDIDFETVIFADVIWGLFLFLYFFIFVDNILSKK
jgi:hypothetical protein